MITPEQLTSYKVLKLNLKAKPFEVMISGEKNVEFRLIKPWMNSRLFDKDGKVRTYDLVQFTLGYGKHKPFFLCEYLGACWVSKIHVRYSNDLVVNFEDERWQINLGEIVQIGNWQLPRVI